MSVVMDKSDQDCWCGAVDQKSRVIKLVE